MSGAAVPALCLRDVSLSGRARPRLDSVSVEIAAGELVAVVGPNGAGKSSLVRVALGLERSSSGEALLDGRAVAGLRSRDRAARLGWLPQRMSVEAGLLAVELVAAARYRFHEAHHASMTAAEAALAQVGAADLAPCRIDHLSGGEVQRVRLAALVAQEAALWLLDEPGNHLDPAHQVELCQILVRQVEAGHGVLIVTHDLGFLPFLEHPSTRVVALADGRVHFDTRLGDPELPALLGELYGVAVHRVRVDGRERFVVGTVAP